MTEDEVQTLIQLAHGQIPYVVCETFNDVRNIRTWMKEYYPYIAIRTRSDIHTGKITLKVKTRPP